MWLISIIKTSCKWLTAFLIWSTNYSPVSGQWGLGVRCGFENGRLRLWPELPACVASVLLIFQWARRCSCHTPVCARRSFFVAGPSSKFGIFSVSICKYSNFPLNTDTLLIIFLRIISPSPNMLCKCHLLIIIYSSSFSLLLASSSVSCLLLSSLCSMCTEVLGHYLTVFRS